MIKLRIKVVQSRSYQCDIAGCRNRTRYLITKRDDIASHPVHLCASCIEGIKALYDEMIAAEVRETAPVTEPETVPAEPVSAQEPAESAEDDGGTDAGAGKETPTDGAEEAEDAPVDGAEPVPDKKPAARRSRRKS